MIKDFYNAYKTYFWVILTVFVFVVFMIILGVSLFLSTQKQTSKTAGGISGPTLSSYNKTVIGENAPNFESDPSFKNKKLLSPGVTQYDFFSVDQLNDDTIITNNGRVVYEKAITVDNNYIHPTISSFEQKFGKPQRIIKGSKTNGPFESFYIYASKGFTLIGNPYTDEVNQIQTYPPMSLDEYIQKWGEEIDKTPSTKENIDSKPTP